MKSKIILTITIFLISAKSLTAQITIPIDSVNTVLCHKWGFKAIVMGGQRLTNMNESVTYVFGSDGTFKRVSSNGKEENGNWTYKSDEKVVQLKLKKTKLHIPSLTRDELIISPGDGAIESGVSMGTVLKLLDNN
jgi:hypothetical protein